MARQLGRRDFVVGASAAALVGAGCNPDAISPKLKDNPFTLGVASGDPLEHAVVLWTRLAPQPTVDGGGMPPAHYRVEFEVANDPSFGRIVRRGWQIARPEHGHSVHADVWGLRPDRWYWYRFRVGNHVSPVGRTRTTPHRSSRNTPLKFGHMSCQRYSSGFYNAYADFASRELDLAVHVGDYIYESGGNGVRSDPLPESVSLDQYRNRYGLYKSDPDLQAAHAAAPWLFTWDDHEVENNYTGLVPEAGSVTPDPAQFRARRDAAYQAYWENLPLRRRPRPNGSLRVHREIRWGKLADLIVLDTRQYRDDQICGTNDIGAACDFSFDPATTVLGTRQERWLDHLLARSRSTWSAMTSSIVFSRVSFTEGTGIYNLDQWDGYQAARSRLLNTIATHRAGRAVMLSGDIHTSLTSQILADYEDGDSTPLGAEFTGTSVSTSGAALDPLYATAVAINPGLQWSDGSKRGWVSHEVTDDAWHTEYRHVDDNTVPGSPVQTAKRWVLPKNDVLAEA